MPSITHVDAILMPTMEEVRSQGSKAWRTLKDKLELTEEGRWTVQRKPAHNLAYQISTSRCSDFEFLAQSSLAAQAKSRRM